MHRRFYPIYIIGILILLYACRRQPAYTPQHNFVHIENDVFKINNDTFFPLMLNYVVNYRLMDSKFVVAPCIYYEDMDCFETDTEEDNQQQIEGHLQLIKEMGFNSIRLIFDRIHFDQNNMPFYWADSNKIYLHQCQKEIIHGLQRFISIAKSEDIKVMLLIKAPFNPQIEKFTIALLKTFQEEPTVFAYDFFNEPLYFDTEKHRTKADAYQIVSHWADLMHQYAPHQLFTIGMAEPLEVFKWDPSVLPVDFVQIHSYNPLRIKSEIYWYKTYIHKPLMLGETALPAENDSIPYQYQCEYFDHVFRYARDCGVCGFGWWEFQDANIGVFEGKYAGILHHDDTTCTADGKHRILGAPKPIAEYTKKALTYTPENKAPRPMNYYNMLGYGNICIKGKVVNNKNKAVEGAVVRAWNSDWSVGMHTFTDNKGNFTLYTNDSCVHFKISAPGMTCEELHCEPSYISGPPKETTPCLPMQKLEYQQINYQHFLRPQAKNIFDFDSTLFSRYIIEAYLPPVQLNKIKLN
ncbi:MAG: carboxypeptidase regulatory-like domain-containing protein [Bacteroidales bacterium]|nr:carboxypeptidase regulatory-like domain-containing protein [Bacteroidales bacterium]